MVVICNPDTNICFFPKSGSTCGIEKKNRFLIWFCLRGWIQIQNPVFVWIKFLQMQYNISRKIYKVPDEMTGSTYVQYWRAYLQLENHVPSELCMDIELEERILCFLFMSLCCRTDLQWQKNLLQMSNICFQQAQENVH